MTSAPMDCDLPPELGDLVGALADGTITPEQQAKLAELLQDSSSARQYYSDYLDLHAELHGHFGGVGTAGCPRGGGLNNPADAQYYSTAATMEAGRGWGGCFSIRCPAKAHPPLSGSPYLVLGI